MNAIRLREFHRFEAAGQPFLYLVPSAAVFALDDVCDAVLSSLEAGDRSREDLVGGLSERFDSALVADSIEELIRIRAIGEWGEPRADRKVGPYAQPGVRADLQVRPQDRPKVIPLVPLSTMVLNVTNKCNLACTYCYEYGEDKIVDTENGKKPKFMSEATARQSVEFMLRESGASPRAHLTFFGGETLLNFPVLKSTVAYARRRAAELGKDVDFSLTTNATLLRPEIIDFLVENQVGVTISIDGPKEMQDRFRVFHDGSPSYEVVMPKIRELLQKHRGRPIGARVTLTRQTLDIQRIYRHLTEDVGFREVGFAPVTTAASRDYAIGDAGFDTLLEQFRDLARDFLSAAVENRHHGFSNVKETIEEIHKGVSKAYPCGAGLGLMGVATDGDVNLCHRFAGSDAHKLGTVADGVDRDAQRRFLEAHHLDDKPVCQTCWARPLCSGGCYHEAYTRYGTTASANLHYCEWIRGWTDTCLQIYGEISVRNPRYLQLFDQEEAGERVT
jgi:uncharacterized protein